MDVNHAVSITKPSAVSCAVSDSSSSSCCSSSSRDNIAIVNDANMSMQVAALTEGARTERTGVRFLSRMHTLVLGERGKVRKALGTDVT